MLGGWSLFGSELSQWSQFPPAALTFFLVALGFCYLHAASATI